MSEDTPRIQVSASDSSAVKVVRMERPARHNAMDEAMATTLATTVDRLAQDDDVRCLVLTGVSGVFNTGADLSTFDGDERDEAKLDAIATPLHEAVETLLTAPKPVVTGVNGVVAGGGLGLALAGDIVLASESARFEYAYPKIGLSGDGGATWLLPRLVGRRTAQEIVFLDRGLDAEEAVEAGLATEVVPDDAFDDRLEAVAETLGSGPTKAYAEAKELLARSSTNDLETHLDLEKARIKTLASTGDYEAGLRGFLEKETPTFEGR